MGKDHYQTKLRTLLNHTYLDRRQRNSSYSLRSFARSLDLDVGYLSRLMSGDRKPGKENAFKVFQKLGVSARDMLALIESTESNGRVRLLDSEFSSISRWYFFAVIELLQIDPNLSVQQVAESLGVEQAEISATLEILESQGHIKRDERGYQVILKSSDWFSNHSTSEQRRAYQKQILENAILGIDSHDMSARENASLMISMDPNLLPEVKSRIHSFIEELQAFVNQQGQKSQVYQIALGLTPLSDNHQRTNLV